MKKNPLSILVKNIQRLYTHDKERKDFFTGWCWLRNGQTPGWPISLNKGISSGGPVTFSLNFPIFLFLCVHVTFLFLVLGLGLGLDLGLLGSFP